MHLNGTEALMNRTSYYEALRSVDPRTQDVTEWLEYSVQGIAVEMVRVESGIVPSHAKRLSPTGGELAAILATLLSIATAIAGHLRLPGMTCDPKDDIVVACAKG
jgi:hypothetical protein